MIEITIRDFLASELDVPVYMERPKDLPGTPYVIFEKTGSSRSNQINRATFAFQSIAGRMYDAIELNETVKAAVEKMTELNRIAKVALNSDYNFTSTASKQYRYQAVYNITYYDN